MTPPDSASAEAAGLEIVNTRVFAAPRAAVFDAFANPTLLAQWWGPHGFTNTINRFEFRPAGAWHLIMHGPDGANYENESQFVEMSRPERIVFEHLRPMHWYRMTMTFVEAGRGETQVTWRMVFHRTAENEKIKPFIHAANEQNFDRLEACLKNAQR